MSLQSLQELLHEVAPAVYNPQTGDVFSPPGDGSKFSSPEHQRRWTTATATLQQKFGQKPVAQWDDGAIRNILKPLGYSNQEVEAVVGRIAAAKVRKPFQQPPQQNRPAVVSPVRTATPIQAPQAR